jgi:hypothetical protein
VPNPPHLPFLDHNNNVCRSIQIMKPFICDLLQLSAPPPTWAPIFWNSYNSRAMLCPPMDCYPQSNFAGLADVCLYASSESSSAFKLRYVPKVQS